MYICTEQRQGRLLQQPEEGEGAFGEELVVREEEAKEEEGEEEEDFGDAFATPEELRFLTGVCA
jgi:hypothetical protein